MKLCFIQNLFIDHVMLVITQLKCPFFTGKIIQFKQLIFAMKDDNDVSDKQTNHVLYENEKKTIEDQTFCVHRTNQVSDFENTSRFIINYIQKTFDKGHNIANKVTKMKEVDTLEWEP